MPKRLSEKKRNSILQRLSEGKGVVDTANFCGVAEGTVSRIKKSVMPPPQDERAFGVSWGAHSVGI